MATSVLYNKTTIAKRILLLDNDADVLDAMLEVFVYAGFEVKAIESAGDIINEVTAYRPDVIMLDFVLNGTNGGELCLELKNNPATGNLPVVIISAQTSVANFYDSYGCDAFIPKPFDIIDLVDHVNAILDAPAGQKHVLITN